MQQVAHACTLQLLRGSARQPVRPSRTAQVAVAILLVSVDHGAVTAPLRGILGHSRRGSAGGSHQPHQHERRAQAHSAGHGNGDGQWVMQTEV